MDSENRAAATGMHLNNRFGQTADDSPYWNNTYHNTARRVYFGDAMAEDGSTPWLSSFGDNNYGKLVLADGEKTSILYDKDGSTTGLVNSLLITKARGSESNPFKKVYYTITQQSKIRRH